MIDERRWDEGSALGHAGALQQIVSFLNEKGGGLRARGAGHRAETQDSASRYITPPGGLGMAAELNERSKP